MDDVSFGKVHDSDGSCAENLTFLLGVYCVEHGLRARSPTLRSPLVCSVLVAFDDSSLATSLLTSTNVRTIIILVSLSASSSSLLSFSPSSLQFGVVRLDHLLTLELE